MFFELCYYWPTENNQGGSDIIRFPCEHELTKFLVEILARGCSVESITTIYFSAADNAIRALDWRDVPKKPKAIKAPRATNAKRGGSK